MIPVGCVQAGLVGDRSVCLIQQGTKQGCKPKTDIDFRNEKNMRPEINSYRAPQRVSRNTATSPTR